MSIQMTNFVGSVVRLFLEEGQFEGTVVSVDANSKKLTLEKGRFGFPPSFLTFTLSKLCRSGQLCDGTETLWPPEVLWTGDKAR